MKLYDSHTHTNHSHDCDVPAEDRVLCAIDDGLDGVCITNHSDFFDFDEVKTKKSIDDAMFLKEKYKDKIYVGAGIEVGTDLNSEEITKHIKSFADNADVTLASIHGIHRKNDVTAPVAGPVSISDDYDMCVEYMQHYAENLLFISEKVDCDVLCHITYPLRYFNGKKNYGIDMWQYEDCFVKIFQNLIKREICLELNLSGMFTPWQTYMPDRKFFELYRSLGGELVCLSTDNHTTKSVRTVMENAIPFLRSLGFKNYVFYKNHTPIEVSLG